MSKTRIALSALLLAAAWGCERFAVKVPNRPPELTSPFDTLTALIGDSVFANIGERFEDPDGHGLTYEIGSVDTSVVTAAMRGLRLWLYGRSPGPTVVTVIANDGWDSLEADVPITVPVPVRPFRDDFDSDASLDDWTAVRADASVQDGGLHVSPDSALEGYVHRHTGDAPAATDRKIMVSMVSADSLGVATVKWQATGSEHTGYYFSIGRPTAAVDSTNWAFGTCISGFPCWTAPGWEDQYGWSYEIEVGVLQEFHIWMEGERAYVRIGEDGPWLMMNGVRPGNRLRRRLAAALRPARTRHVRRRQARPHGRLALSAGASYTLGLLDIGDGGSDEFLKTRTLALRVGVVLPVD